MIDAMFLWVDTRCNEPMICSDVELRMALVSTFCTQNLTLLEKSSLKSLFIEVGDSVQSIPTEIAVRTPRVTGNQKLDEILARPEASVDQVAALADLMT